MQIYITSLSVTAGKEVLDLFWYFKCLFSTTPTCINTNVPRPGTPKEAVIGHVIFKCKANPSIEKNCEDDMNVVHV